MPKRFLKFCSLTILQKVKEYVWQGAVRKYLACGLAVALMSTPALAAPWVRGYVVTNYEPAWHYGGSATFQKVGVLEPGTDCPQGTFPEIDYKSVLLTPWRDAKAVEKLINPPNTDLKAIQYLQLHALTYRGFRDGIDVYLNPFAAPDPGIQQVTGKIGEGFDLDNNPTTGGFTSPDGQKGIDNAYYRAWGCIAGFRGMPYHAGMSMRANDKMVEGLYTFVIRVSGNKDPMNDDDATVEVGFSPDHMLKAANDNVLADYSFRIVQNGEYSKVKARVRNGVVDTETADELHAPRFSWFPNQYGDADFRKGRLRLVTDVNGDVSGLIGGYRDWRELWVEDNFSQEGGIEEQRDHQNSMGMYYAIKRNADGMADPRTGKKMGISIAYRFRAQPAFVVDPTKSAPSTIAINSDIERQIALIDAHRAAFLKAIATRQIQPLPPGSREGFNGMVVQLPDGSWQFVGRPVRPVTSPKQPDAGAPEKAGQQQVQNGVPTIPTSAAIR